MSKSGNGSNKRKADDDEKPRKKCRNGCQGNLYDPDMCAIQNCGHKAFYKIKFPGFFEREYYETMICYDHYDYYDKNPDFFQAINFKRKYCSRCKNSDDPVPDLDYYDTEFFKKSIPDFYMTEEETIREFGYTFNSAEIKRHAYEKYKYNKPQKECKWVKKFVTPPSNK